MAWFNGVHLGLCYFYIQPIYINNISNLNIFGKLFLFADDGLVLNIGKTGLEARNKVLHDIMVTNYSNLFQMVSKFVWFDTLCRISWKRHLIVAIHIMNSFIRCQKHCKYILMYLYSHFCLLIYTFVLSSHVVMLFDSNTQVYLKHRFTRDVC